jgi:site-specific DNA recombinase
MIGRSAKSHRYYYYVCNGKFRQGKDACGARILPKDRLEQLVIDQVKERVLKEDVLEQLAKLVNEELESTHSMTDEKLHTIDFELTDVKQRLCNLYDALETKKVNLDDLAPRIKELRARQDELRKARIQLEAEQVLKASEQLDITKVKSYVQDLRSLLEEANIIQSKSFLRSFIKRIEVRGKQVVIDYNLPLPSRYGKQEATEVLPIVHYGGEGGTRTPTPCGTGS